MGVERAGNFPGTFDTHEKPGLHGIGGVRNFPDCLQRAPGGRACPFVLDHADREGGALDAVAWRFTHPLQNQRLDPRSNREPRLRNGAPLLAGMPTRQGKCASAPPALLAEQSAISCFGLALVHAAGVRLHRHCTPVTRVLQPGRFGAVAAPRGSGFFTSLTCCAHGSVYGGSVLGNRKVRRSQIPVCKPDTRPPPSFCSGGGRFKTC